MIEGKIGLTTLPCESEDVLRHELAHLVEDRDEILITGRDLFVCLQTAVLEDTVQDSRSVDRFASAMEEAEQGEDIDIDLAILLIFVSVPELIRVKSLGEVAFWVGKRRPSFRRQNRFKSSESDPALRSTVLMGALNLDLHRCEQGSVEGQGHLELFERISDASKVDRWQVDHGLRHCCDSLVRLATIANSSHIALCDVVFLLR